MLPKKLLVPFACCAFALSGCVTLVAPYDDQIDGMATNLQHDISAEIETLSRAEKPACLYPNHVEFYKKANADVSALGVRARAHELNSLTIGQVDALDGALDDLESLHKLATTSDRCMEAREFSDIQRAFDSITGAIVKLEIAKKRGK